MENWKKKCCKCVYEWHKGLLTVSTINGEKLESKHGKKTTIWWSKKKTKNKNTHTEKTTTSNQNKTKKKKQKKNNNNNKNPTVMAWMRNSVFLFLGVDYK